MATPAIRGEPVDAERKSNRNRIRNNVLVLVSLLALIALQFAFLLNYSGFHGWQKIDANLLIFVAVNVNIVLLTAVFYMILRHVFKLIYERKKPLAGVSLRAKLIVAFMALSLPSTAFHLTASGFIARLFDSWTLGEYREVMDNVRVVVDGLNNREHQNLRLYTEQLVRVLPRDPESYRREEWLEGHVPDLVGAIYVYGANREVVASWLSNPGLSKFWTPPQRAYFEAQEGFYWVQTVRDRQVRRMLMPLLDGPEPLKVEVMQVSTKALSQAVMTLDYKGETSAVLGRDLILLVLTILIGVTLLIIFAATWIAFYLARGFVTPVVLLSDATQRVSEGELGYQVAESALGPLQRDFAGLVDSFNRMSRQLKEQRLQLIETTENLRSSHQELGERNRFVELLLENIDLGIISLNIQGDLTTVNRWAFRLLQLKREHHLTRHYRAVLDHELVALLDGLLERIRTSPQRRAKQNLTLTANSKPMHVEVTMLPLDTESGEPEGFVVMLEDVTDLQRTQRALAWREVARRVAHEIKNPLTPIQLSTQRIRRKYLPGMGGDAEVLDQCTQTIIDQVTSLKKMVNEFSEFAKLPESKPTPGDLNQVVQEVARLYQSGLPENIHLKLDLADDLPALPLDAEQLKRVFTNLIDNAAASITGQGTITVHTAYHPETQLALAEVIDDGSGVPEEVRSRLFEPYTSTKEGGTGLGLTIVNQIVSDHNGFVRYADRKPHGSVFSIEFRVR